MSNKFTVVVAGDVSVLGVEILVVCNSSRAFLDLEAKIGSLKGKD